GEGVGLRRVAVEVERVEAGEVADERGVRRPEVGAAAEGRVVAVGAVAVGAAGTRWTRLEVLGDRVALLVDKGLPDQARPDVLAVVLDERAVGFVLETELGDAGDDEPVPDAEQ